MLASQHPAWKHIVDLSGFLQQLRSWHVCLHSQAHLVYSWSSHTGMKGAEPRMAAVSGSLSAGRKGYIQKLANPCHEAVHMQVACYALSAERMMGGQVRVVQEALTSDAVGGHDNFTHCTGCGGHCRQGRHSACQSSHRVTSGSVLLHQLQAKRIQHEREAAGAEPRHASRQLE